MRTVVVSGTFDNLRSRHVRFLQEARKLGDSLHVLLWSDAAVRASEGGPPTFPEGERRYLLEAIRFVDRVWSVDGSPDRFSLPPVESLRPAVWAVDERELALPEAGARRQVFCREQGIEYQLLSAADLAGFPDDTGAATLSTSPASPTSPTSPTGRKMAFVTGCYDWLHSGHIRFFEEVSTLGDLYVAVGNDASVRYLKGEGHPLFPQEERRYMAGAIRYVKQALITSGQGWMDATPDIERLKPDIYAVNEDGDRPEKRAFCQEHGLQYVVLKRTPKEGLPKRESTVLRGF
jgi:cytidyltransferase-like protein